jgi:hypothetical protein
LFASGSLPVRFLFASCLLSITNHFSITNHHSHQEHNASYRDAILEGCRIAVTAGVLLPASVTAIVKKYQKEPEVLCQYCGGR